MSTRSMIMAAVVAAALPLGAAPVLAQGSGAGTSSFQGGTYRMEHPHNQGGEHTSVAPMPAKKKAPAHAAAHPKSMAVPAGAASTNQLNDMSLAAARQGQSFAPAAPAAPPADTGAKKKM